ncbi:acyl-CoA carboxylase epsilon subunit [Streptomyces monticola]|uniref:Acyl-CoA carboxylase epsilon subunit n=1 Tax=Streptomyces monticola TaxID=2666263 RepID=A0ABW2JTM6_9ACTN
MSTAVPAGREAEAGSDGPAGQEAADPRLVIKVVRGRAAPSELAALTALLYARAAALAEQDPEPEPGSAQAGWRRPERMPHHRDPRGRWAAPGRR